MIGENVHREREREKTVEPDRRARPATLGLGFAGCGGGTAAIHTLLSAAAVGDFTTRSSARHE